MEQDCSTRLWHSLAEPAGFTVTFELVPGRSARSKEYGRTLALARELAADGRLQAVSITENAGGHPALSPEVLGSEILALGLDVIVHLSCKDKNRNQLESLLYAWDRAGLCNLLVVTGDYPQRGYMGNSKPVFDLGSVQLLDLLSRMNRGDTGHGDERSIREPLPPTSFVKGVAVSPFKLLEAEAMMQYYKLHRKAAAGADFAITQLGYDARKFEELLIYMRQADLRLPVLGNVFIPSLAVAELIHRGRVPGCVITDAQYALIQEEARSADRGKRARLIRAAKLMAVLKGLGYDGVHIGGPGLTARDLDFLMTEAENRGRDWRQWIEELSFWPDDAFYLFERDEATGLNRPNAAPRSASASLPEAAHYRLSEAAHDLLFEEQGALFRPFRRLCLAFDETGLKGALSTLEHVVKFLLFGCRNCGDCTLAELAFVCPQAGCAKFLLNGPCGGSRDGWCEVYPGQKRCHFVRVYERLRPLGRDSAMRQGLVPPRNWALNETSSWVNFYQGRDHQGRHR